MLLISLQGNAATLNPTKEDTAAKIISFSSVPAESKVYLKWTVQNQKKDGFYIIERSADNDAFEYAGHFEGIGVPVEAPILYCFADSLFKNRITYYRVIHINADGEVLKTSPIKVEIPEALIAPKTGKIKTHFSEKNYMTPAVIGKRSNTKA